MKLPVHSPSQEKLSLCGRVSWPTSPPAACKFCPVLSGQESTPEKGSLGSLCTLEIWLQPLYHIRALVLPPRYSGPTKAAL